jgi:cardiolipin synthase (CMP-forming)
LLLANFYALDGAKSERLGSAQAPDLLGVGAHELKLQEPFGVSIPNLITLGRVILVPVVFWLLLSGQLQAAFLAFVVAGISDAVDGFLAKRYHWETELGAYLDPIADKLLIVCIFIALGVTYRLPSWLVIIVVSRDVLIIIAIVLSWLLNHPTPMKPLAVSKMNTVAQIVLAATVLADEAFGLRLKGPVLVLTWLTAATTIASLAAYLRVWLRHMTLFESTGSKS